MSQTCKGCNYYDTSRGLGICKANGEDSPCKICSNNNNAPVCGLCCDEECYFKKKNQ